MHQVWQAYREGQPDGYSNSRFCELLREWRKTSEVVMRLVHKAGEALFVDYAGQSVPIVDPDTGAVMRAQIFASTLGYFSYTYAEAAIRAYGREMENRAIYSRAALAIARKHPRLALAARDLARRQLWSFAELVAWLKEHGPLWDED